jgi:hypothetical protein
MRSSAAPGAPQTVVYNGKGKAFSDRKVQNGVEYRYVLTSFDQTGNNSAGVAVAATPKRALLVAPRDAAKVKGPPTLKWVATAGARFYNVQLFRRDKKILSAWPAKNLLALHKAWKFRGRQYRLTAGLYRWYVWPGIGPKADAKYGPLLGTSTFQIAG